MDKKVLIVSHNPFSNEDNMGRTLTNLFEGFDERNLCQLFFHNQHPDFGVCKNYYNINEIAVLKSTFMKGISTGRICTEENFQENNSNQKRSKLKEYVYRLGSRRTQVVYFLRNLVWALGKWKSQELLNWLTFQKPTCIFFAAGDYSFLFKIVLELSKILQIPIYTYYVDEYYLSKRKNQKIPADAFVYRKYFKKIVNASDMNFCISEMMCSKYKEIFKKEFELLTNPFKMIHQPVTSVGKNNLYMCYYGNLTFNRWKNLSVLATKISEMNKKYERKIRFEVFSAENDIKLLNEFQKNKNVNFMGKVTPRELEEVIDVADILVHVEDYGERYKDTVRYSISTKIPELLTSQRVILCMGPTDLEPINYLERNDAGIIVKSLEELEEKLELIYKNVDTDYLINNALALAYKNHTKENNRAILKYYLLEKKNEEDITN